MIAGCLRKTMNSKLAAALFIFVFEIVYTSSVYYVAYYYTHSIIPTLFFAGVYMNLYHINDNIRRLND